MEKLLPFFPHNGKMFRRFSTQWKECLPRPFLPQVLHWRAREKFITWDGEDAQMTHHWIRIFLLIVASLAWAGCEGGGDGTPQSYVSGNKNPDVVVAFGDSITQGHYCDTPYPMRLGILTGKNVVNAGKSGTLARNNIDRARTHIDQAQPGFMLILYGIIDVVGGHGTGAAVDALRGMVRICKDNQVVPVLATYPVPVGPSAGLAGAIRSFNEGIRALAKEQGIPCVDLEAEFGANPKLFGSDGLHPNDLGMHVMAMAFGDLF